VLSRIFLVIIVLLSTIRIGYGEQSTPSITPAVYDEVLNRVFKHDWTNPSEFVVRFDLEEHWPELQIAFAPQATAAPCDVDFWYVSRGPATIRDQLQSILALEPTLSADQAATRVNVTHERRRLDCRSRLARLLKRGVPLKLQVGDADAMLSRGSHYSFEFRSLSTTVRIVTSGPPTGAPSLRGIHKWLNDVHIAAERYLGFAGAQPRK
jgi:hypothetical protein